MNRAQVPLHTWLHVFSFVDLSSLAALQLSSSSFYQLIRDNDYLWEKALNNAHHIIPSPPTPHSPILSLTRTLYKSCSSSKQKAIGWYIKQRIHDSKCDALFSKAFNPLLQIGQVGQVVFALPFFLSPVVLYINNIYFTCVSIFFSLLVGCLCIARALWKHAVLMYLFSRESKSVGWIIPTSVDRYPLSIQYRFDNPIATFLVLGCASAMTMCITFPLATIFSSLSASELLPLSWYFSFLVLTALNCTRTAKLAIIFLLFALAAVSIFYFSSMPLRVAQFLFAVFSHPIFFYSTQLLQNQLSFSSINRLLVFAFVQSTIAPVLLLFPVLLKPRLFSNILAGALVFLVLEFTAFITVFYHAYKLVAFKENRWWMLAYWAPVLSFVLALQVNDMSWKALIIGLCVGTIVGTLSLLLTRNHLSNRLEAITLVKTLLAHQHSSNFFVNMTFYLLSL